MNALLVMSTYRFVVQQLYMYSYLNPNIASTFLEQCNQQIIITIY